MDVPDKPTPDEPEASSHDDALSPHDIDELLKRAAAAEEAERRGETIAFDDLMHEVDQIIHGSVSD